MQDQKDKRGLLEKIQSLDYQTKTKLWVVLSILIILLVVYIWGAYFNFMLAKISQNNLVKNQNDQPGFWEKIKMGGAFAFQIIISGAKQLVTIFSRSQDYIIK